MSQPAITIDTITSEMLDDLVHNQCSAMASGINNDGKDAQLEFLRGRRLTDAEIIAAVQEDMQASAAFADALNASGAD